MTVQHLLAPVDGSPNSEGALRIAETIAQKFGALVSLFNALPTERGYALATVPTFVDRLALIPKPLNDIHELIAEHAKRYLQGLVGQPPPRGWEAKPIELDWEDLESDYPYRAILGAVEQLGCDLIVMASHGHKGLLGSHKSNADSLWIKRIRLCATDSSRQITTAGNPRESNRKYQCEFRGIQPVVITSASLAHSQRYAKSQSPRMARS